MTAPATAPPLSDFVSELFERAAPRRSLRHIAWGVALLVHASVVAVAVKEGRAAAAQSRPLEVELAPPEPPAPEPPAPPKTEEPVQRAAVARPASVAPPEPARAGALVTAKEDPTPTPDAEEPVDFTNDPSALGFGAGVVAIGGTAKVGLAQAQPSPAPSAPPATPGAVGDALTPASDLSRKPSLGESDPCRGFFPSTASDDVATAAVMVTIGRSGAVSAVQLLSESPSKQGFGSAARACMGGKRFSPGLDRDGRPTATKIRVNVRFSR
jgi:periplasmic protein TonB